MDAVIPGKKANQFNLAAQARRQAGSTFKTFVLAAAIEQGVNPDSTYYTSAPFLYQPDPLGTPGDGEVETYGNDYLGSTSIDSATLRSDNTVYAQLTLDLGPEDVADDGPQARRHGRPAARRYVPSIGLGAIAVSPLEMASAYATLAAGGIYSQPMAIRKVVLPGGKVDKDAGWGKPKRKRVISDGVAYEVTKILERQHQRRDRHGARHRRPAAGKTGTTDNHADAWFCGYTPHLRRPSGSATRRRDPDGERARDLRRRRHVPGGDLAPVHGGRAGRPASRLAGATPKNWPVWEPFDHGTYSNSTGYGDFDSETRRPRRRRPTPPPPKPPPRRIRLRLRRRPTTRPHAGRPSRRRRPLPDAAASAAAAAACAVLRLAAPRRARRPRARRALRRARVAERLAARAR